MTGMKGTQGTGGCWTGPSGVARDGPAPAMATPPIPRLRRSAVNARCRSRGGGRKQPPSARRSVRAMTSDIGICGRLLRPAKSFTTGRGSVTGLCAPASGGSGLWPARVRDGGVAGPSATQRSRGVVSSPPLLPASAASGADAVAAAHGAANGSAGAVGGGLVPVAAGCAGAAGAAGSAPGVAAVMGMQGQPRRSAVSRMKSKPSSG